MRLPDLPGWAWTMAVLFGLVIIASVFVLLDKLVRSF